MDCELVTVWLAPGEDLRSLEPSTLNFNMHDDEMLLACRHRAKMELGPQIRERSAGGKPVVVEAAFGPNPEQAGENPYGRTIADLFARLVEQGTLIRRVPNDHDDVERFRADIVAAFEDLFGGDSLESWVNGSRERE